MPPPLPPPKKKKKKKNINMEKIVKILIKPYRGTDFVELKESCKILNKTLWCY